MGINPNKTRIEAAIMRISDQQEKEYNQQHVEKWLVPAYLASWKSNSSQRSLKSVTSSCVTSCPDIFLPMWVEPLYIIIWHYLTQLCFGRGPALQKPSLGEAMLIRGQAQLRASPSQIRASAAHPGLTLSMDR